MWKASRWLAESLAISQGDLIWLWGKKNIVGDHRFWSIFPLPMGFCSYLFLTHSHIVMLIAPCESLWDSWLWALEHDQKLWSLEF